MSDVEAKTETEEVKSDSSPWQNIVAILALLGTIIGLGIVIYAATVKGPKGEKGDTVIGNKGDTGAEGPGGAAGNITNAYPLFVTRYFISAQGQGSASTAADTEEVFLYDTLVEINSQAVLPGTFIINIQFNYVIRKNDTLANNDSDKSISIHPVNIAFVPTLNGGGTIPGNTMGLFGESGMELASGTFYKMQNMGHYNATYSYNTDAIRSSIDATINARKFRVGVNMYNGSGKATTVGISNVNIIITN
jgi:hypothetical protein